MEVKITADSRILILLQLNCSRYREKLNTAMRESYQNATKGISSKVDSWIFFQTEVSISEYCTGIERVIRDFPGFLHL